MKIIEYTYKNYKLIHYLLFRDMLDELYINDKLILKMCFSTQTLEGRNTNKIELYDIKPTNKRLSFYFALSNEGISLPDEILTLLEKRWLTDSTRLMVVPPTNWNVKVIEID